MGYSSYSNSWTQTVYGKSHGTFTLQMVMRAYPRNYQKNIKMVLQAYIKSSDTLITNSSCTLKWNINGSTYSNNVSYAITQKNTYFFLCQREITISASTNTFTPTLQITDTNNSGDYRPNGTLTASNISDLLKRGYEAPIVTLSHFGLKSGKTLTATIRNYNSSYYYKVTAYREYVTDSSLSGQLLNIRFTRGTTYTISGSGSSYTINMPTFSTSGYYYNRLAIEVKAYTNSSMTESTCIGSETQVCYFIPTNSGSTSPDLEELRMSWSNSSYPYLVGYNSSFNTVTFTAIVKAYGGNNITAGGISMYNGSSTGHPSTSITSTTQATFTKSLSGPTAVQSLSYRNITICGWM